MTEQTEFQHKPGALSPSGFAQMMTNDRSGKGLGKTALEYAARITLERMGVIIPEPFSKALEWGIENEEKALAYYEHLHGMVTPTGRLIHPEINYIAGTPDGLIGEDGIIEIKCPYNPMNHFANITENAQLKDYGYQIQGYMWITDRKWCDFVSFDLRFPESKRLHVVRIDRDDQIIDALAERAALINSIVEENLAKMGYNQNTTT